MIIIRMQGGLGNQMFQYAAGVALAHRHSCDLLWDLSAYDGPNSHRSFELDYVFGIHLSRADDISFRAVLGWRANYSLKTMFGRGQLAFIRPKSYVIEPHFEYWHGLLETPDNSYLDGYWQSERYFRNVADTIRRTFAFPPAPSGRDQRMAERIRSCTSVSVHVRRGDYITNPRANDVHGCCSTEYYRQAAVRMIDHLGDVHFFVFSDDPTWAQNNLDLPGTCTYIDHNQGNSSYADMQLMSLCKHHIIANSSFSWWGAWLGTSAGTQVIAPKQWFRNRLLDTSDLYCPEWLLL